MGGASFDRTRSMLGLGAFIRTRRGELGLTQTELGARIGYYQERISALERGTYGIPSLSSLYELASALEVPVASLLAHAGCPAGSHAVDPAVVQRTVPAVVEKTELLRAQHEALCQRLSRAEELATRVEQLRVELMESQARVRRLTASCLQSAPYRLEEYDTAQR